MHTALGVVLLLGLHGAYTAYYGARTDGPPAYLRMEGSFLLAGWGPLLEPQDAPSPELAAVIAAPGALPRDDRHTNNSQLWARDGLTDRWKRAVSDDVRADALAMQTVMNAFRARPWEKPALMAAVWLDYFRDDGAAHVEFEQGVHRPLPRAMRERLRESFSLAAGASWAARPSLVKSMHMQGRGWYYVLALAPVLTLILLLGWRCGSVSERLLLAGVSVLLMAAACVLTVSFRYLHPQDFVVAVATGWIASTWAGSLGRRGRAR